MVVSIIFFLFLLTIGQYDIANNENYADYNVSDKKRIVHWFFPGKNLIPKNKQITANSMPMEKVNRSKFFPENPGAKTGMKDDPTKSFERSIIYSDIFSFLYADTFTINGSDITTKNFIKNCNF